MGLLEDEVAMITEVGSGTGKATVRLFVEERARVVATDVSGAEKDTAKQVGRNVPPVHCDVTQEANAEALMRAAVAELGRLDAVLDVAGAAFLASDHASFVSAAMIPSTAAAR